VGLLLLVLIGVVLVVVWGGAAWAAYKGGNELDLTEANTNFFSWPYGFPLVVPLWWLRRRRGPPAHAGREERPATVDADGHTTSH
jgi:hypothetical protein